MGLCSCSKAKPGMPQGKFVSRRLSAGVAELLPVFNFMGLNIFALSCLCFRIVLSLEKSSLLPPGSLSGVGFQEVHGSFGSLSPARRGVSPCVTWLSCVHVEMGRHHSIQVMSAERGGLCLPCSPLLSLKDPAKPPLLYLTKVHGNVFFSSCYCLHQLLQESDEIRGWMPKTWWL